MTYARSLLSARLHRVKQVMGIDPTPTRGAIIGFLYELRASQRIYLWHGLHRATRGWETHWAQGTLAEIREFIIYLIVLDREGKARYSKEKARILRQAN